MNCRLATAKWDRWHEVSRVFKPAPDHRMIRMADCETRVRSKRPRGKVVPIRSADPVQLQGGAAAASSYCGMRAFVGGLELEDTSTCRVLSLAQSGAAKHTPVLEQPCMGDASSVAWWSDCCGSCMRNAAWIAWVSDPRVYGEGSRGSTFPSNLSTGRLPRSKSLPRISLPPAPSLSCMLLLLAFSSGRMRVMLKQTLNSHS